MNILFQLRELGFNNLTAIEGATDFLRRSGEIYNTLHPFYIGPQSKQKLKDGENDMMLTDFHIHLILLNVIQCRSLLH